MTFYYSDRTITTGYLYAIFLLHFLSKYVIILPWYSIIWFLDFLDILCCQWCTCRKEHSPNLVMKFTLWLENKNALFIFTLPEFVSGNTGKQGTNLTLCRTNFTNHFPNINFDLWKKYKKVDYCPHCAWMRMFLWHKYFFFFFFNYPFWLLQ